MPVVTAIRVENSIDRSHLHIVGVWTSEGTYRNNREVARSIESGEQWVSTNGGEKVPIGWVRWCPGMNCHEAPYLVSSGSFQYHVRGGLNIRRVESSPDRLENLPVKGSQALAAMPAGTPMVGAAQTA